MENAALVIGAWSAFATLLLTVFGWVLRQIVSSIVKNEMKQQSEWLKTKFAEMKTQYAQHITQYHSPQRR